jgi:hypothetical protein
MLNNTECDYDFSDPALPDPHANDEDRAADLLLELIAIFEGDPLRSRVSSRKELNQATDILLQLESLHINRSSDAWAEITRLKRIWKHRIEGQHDVDRWMIDHRRPIY